MPEIDNLDHFSKLLLTSFLERFPDHTDAVQVKCEDRPAHVLIEIACPSPAAQGDLFIATYDGMLTIGFDSFHCHYHQFSESVAEAEIERGLDFVADLFAERYGVITCFSGNKISESRAVKLPHPGPLTSPREVTVKSWLAAFDRKVTLTLRSWLGTFDREESIDSTAF